MTAFTPAHYEALIRRYFEARNAADEQALLDCFIPEAAHYFPAGLPQVPWRSARTIARQWRWCVQALGSQWTLERLVVSHDRPEAVTEWTHWKNRSGTALRGAEWYDFDPVSGRIAEIRAYDAAPADPGAATSELIGFDYAGRGYHLKSG